MTNDRDNRRKEDLKRELDRLRQYAATTRVDHAESARLTDKHVAGLSRILLPKVGSALREEVSPALIAKEWVSEARTVATWLLRTGAVDPMAHASLGVPKAQAAGVRRHLVRLKQFLGLESENAEGAVAAMPLSWNQSEQQLVDSLEAQLKNSAYYEVGEDEVKEHSTDLARLLISNWFGVLEDAVQAQPDEAVKLEYRAFPPSASPSVVTEGCETFALPAEQSISLVFEYQESLAEPGHSVELSPIVSLYRSKTGPWYAFHNKRSAVLDALRSREPRKDVVARVMQAISLSGADRATQSSQSLPLEDAVALATQAFSPLAIGRAMQFHGSLSMKTALVHECSVAAAKAVRLRIQNRSASSVGRASVESYVTCAYAPNLTRNIAHVLLQDLDALSTPNPKVVVNVSQLLRIAARCDKERGFPSLGDAYMLALPTAAALFAAGLEEMQSARVAAADYPSDLDVEDTLFSAAVEIVTSAVEESESQSGQDSLCHNLRNMMELGHEPSAFGLLSS